MQQRIKAVLKAKRGQNQYQQGVPNKVPSECMCQFDKSCNQLMVSAELLRRLVKLINTISALKSTPLIKCNYAYHYCIACAYVLYITGPEPRKGLCEEPVTFVSLRMEKESMLMHLSL